MAHKSLHAISYIKFFKGEEAGNENEINEKIKIPAYFPIIEGAFLNVS